MAEISRRLQLQGISFGKPEPMDPIPIIVTEYGVVESQERVMQSAVDLRGATAGMGMR